METKYKVTLERIQSKIKGVTYTTLPSGKVMICEITLENGFTVQGEAGVVDKANFVQELGEKYSYEKALDKIWMIEGYLMQEHMFQGVEP